MSLAELLLTKDPLVQEFLKWKLSEKKFSPLLALGGKRFIAAKVMQEDCDMKVDANLQNYPNDLTVYEETGISILQSVSYHLSSDVFCLIRDLARKLVKSYQEMDIKPAPKALPFRSIFLTEENCNFVMTSREGRQLDAFALGVYGPPENGLYNVLHFWSQNSKLQIIKGQQHQGITDALCLFLEEKILKIREEKPNRQFRKNSANPNELIRVISLRDYDYERKELISADQSREYARQWIVRGHPRAQWYPSLQQHQWIWIDPHKKGPEGAPFIESVRHVCR